jgi:hypothetical protein
MCRTIREVDVKMRKAARFEQVGKIERIPGSHSGLVGGTILPFVARDELGWPPPGAFGFLFTEFQDALGRRIMNRCFEPREVSVPERRMRRIDAEYLDFHSGPLKREHFGIDESLRDDRVSAEKVCNTHSGRFRGR